MTQKKLRTIARVCLAEYLNGKTDDIQRVAFAIQVLNAPVARGE